MLGYQYVIYISIIYPQAISSLAGGFDTSNQSEYICLRIARMIYFLTQISFYSGTTSVPAAAPISPLPSDLVSDPQFLHVGKICELAVVGAYSIQSALSSLGPGTEIIHLCETVYRMWCSLYYLFQCNSGKLLHIWHLIPLYHMPSCPAICNGLYAIEGLLLVIPSPYSEKPINPYLLRHKGLTMWQSA